MRRSGSRLVLAGALLCSATTVDAQTFFGVDLSGSATTNAATAQDAFLAMLSGVGTESFETLPLGTSNPALVFPGAGTATLSGEGGEVRDFSTAGRFATTGKNFYSAQSATGGAATFTITFSDPVAAFGFFGTDIGDFGSQLTLRFFLAGGGTFDWALPYVAGGAHEANLIYAGYVNTATFTSVQFLGTDASDFFGFDDMTIGAVDQVVPPSVVPEPSTVLLLGSGLLGMMGVAYRRRRLES